MNILQKVTWKSMRQNRTRTIVTVIGVVLSAAMFTAVTTFCSSLMNYLERSVIYQDGDYHISVTCTDTALYQRLCNDSDTQTSVSLQYIGYANSASENDYKPYLYVAGANREFFNSMPVHLTQGRMPENDTEILLPQHLSENGGVPITVGQTLTLELGDRMSDGFQLFQKTMYLGEGEETETLEVREVRSYTVVGIYERGSFEGYSAPGYTALTRMEVASAEVSEERPCTLYLKVQHPKDIGDYLTRNGLSESAADYNWDVLAFSGVWAYNNIGSVVFGLGAIFVCLILLGSVSMIYSAFSISASERTKQFGLLSSIGATKRQIRRSVRFEAFAVALIGIPAGILVGIAGMGVTFFFVGDKFQSIMSAPFAAALYVTPLSLIGAAVISFFTVLISVWIPAKRASSVSAVEAIRQSRDVADKGRPVKTSRLVYCLFSLEGVLAKKYFKRSKKKYRATIVSLTMSVVLFVSANTFCQYLTSTVESGISTSNFDVCYSADDNKVLPEGMMRQLQSAPGVKDAAYSMCKVVDIVLSDAEVDPAYRDFMKKIREYSDPSAAIYRIDPDSYRQIVEENGLDRTKYLDSDNPPAIVVNHASVTTMEESPAGSKRVSYSFDFLKKDVSELTVIEDYPKQDGYTFVGYDDTMEHYCYVEDGSDKLDENDEDELVKNADLTVPVTRSALALGDQISDAPLGVRTFGCVVLIYPETSVSFTAESFPDFNNFIYFTADDHDRMMPEIKNILSSYGFSTSSGYFFDVIEQERSNRDLITLVNVFSYGFIVLISLICVANVFNTISTNVALRRRDFAMLRSVGMTKGGMRRMMNYECLLYGWRALLFGIPLSFLMALLIFRVVQGAVVSVFSLPWFAIAVAVFSVFVVVFASMLYAMNKVKKDNPIEALKDENI